MVRADGRAGRHHGRHRAVIAEHFQQLRRPAAVQELSATRTRGKPPFPGGYCTSVNEAVVHGIPNDRPLVEGDILSVDTGCRLNGWCGDAACDLPGRPHFARTCSGCSTSPQGTLDLAIELMRTKSYWSQVAREMASLRARPRLLDGRMLRRPRHRPGHARGAAGAEFPQPLACAAAATSASSRGW